MIWRTYAELLGGHYHVTVYCAKGPDLTFACVGELVMREDDYTSFRAKFTADHRMRKTEKTE